MSGRAGNRAVPVGHPVAQASLEPGVVAGQGVGRPDRQAKVVYGDRRGRGGELLGRVVDLFGVPRDKGPQIQTKDSWPIYRNTPMYNDITTPKEILFTGIKGIDLFCPILRGGKIGFVEARAWSEAH